MVRRKYVMRSIPSTIFTFRQSSFPLTGMVVRLFTARAILAFWAVVQQDQLARVDGRGLLRLAPGRHRRQLRQGGVGGRHAHGGCRPKIPANLAQYFAAVRLPEASFIPVSSTSMMPMSSLPVVWKGRTSFTVR